jgi:RNA polymerase sigma-70 factor (ECF subfamily)
MDGFRNESSYKTWLYRITVNKCKDVNRSNRFKNSHVFEEVAEKFNTTERTPEMELIQNEEAYFITKNVLQLPVKYREILILYYFEDFNG